MNSDRDPNLLASINWHEGLFLRQQHLQLMQRQSGARVVRERELLWPHPFGVISFELSESDLARGIVCFTQLRAIMPSGIEVDVPGNCAIKAINLSELTAGGSKGPGDVLIQLAVPLWCANRANTAGSAASSEDYLYRNSEIQVSDENTGADPQGIQVRQLGAKLVAGSDSTDDLELLPLCRIVYTTETGVVIPKLDSRYIAPSMVLSASKVLQSMVWSLADQMELKRKELIKQRELSPALDRLGESQLEQLLRLRTLNAATPRLQQLLRLWNVSPFTIYLELRGVLGELATMHTDRDPTPIPDYDHAALFAVFDILIRKIRGLLQPRSEPRVLELKLKSDGRTVSGRMTDEHILHAGPWYLAVRSTDDPNAIAALVTDRDKLRLLPLSLIRQDIRGVKLVEQRDPITGLPPRGNGLSYYLLDVTDPLSFKAWERIRIERSLGIGSPSGDLSTLDAALYAPTAGRG